MPEQLLKKASKIRYVILGKEGETVVGETSYGYIPQTGNLVTIDEATYTVRQVEINFDDGIITVVF